MQQRYSLQARSSQERPSIAVQNVFEYNVENSSQEVWERFGIDLTETIVDIINQEKIIHAPINETDFRALQQQVDPLRPSDVQGIDIYEEVIKFVLDLDRRQEES
ncbi:hypothetical protein HOLleu_20923 [Holothuria leucospilota]|uniref:Uncharacterized protein n=1 Tax=Holothuria leucospilota TaxID=206669 RepID=A0A9Q1BX43_HOLLE|nr:hypothetical protein HOLleu_20923 [Holothuria leucospilota]